MIVLINFIDFDHSLVNFGFGKIKKFKKTDPKWPPFDNMPLF